MASGSQSGWLEKSSRDAFGNWFSGLFGLDLRSLAVYRIGMGLLLLSDLILRSRDLFAHYTDWGIQPRDVSVYRPSHLMLHQLSGSAWYEAMMFIIAGFFALLMLVGCWTRVATCVSWLLLASVQARIPLTNDGAQDLMRVLMFWNMFLPLGARYSVDAALNISLSRRTKRVASVATFALMAQLCLMYWISYRFKTSSEWRSDGSAVYYALSLDMLTTSLGSWLREFPVFLRGLTYFVMGLEATAPLVFFFPWRNALFRLVLIVLMCGMHAGFILCMWIEIFPFLCIVAWMAFVPSLAWDWLAGRLRSPRRQGLALYYDVASGWSRRRALWARTFCILPQMRIRRLAVNPAAAALAKQHGGPVLIDAQGRGYCGRVALREMLCRSPVAWPLGWIVSWFVSDRATPRPARSELSQRRWLEELTVLFPFRRMRLRPWWITQAFVAVWLVYVLGYNLNQIGINSIDLGKIPEMVRDPGTFPDAMLVSSSGNGTFQFNFNDWMNYRPTWKFSTPHTVLWSFRMLGLELRLDQRWAMFAPNPLKDDGWFVFAARLEDNTSIDLWTEKPVTFARPRWVAHKFPNYRWFKFMENFLGPTSNTGFHPHIGRYFHRQWNERHPDNKIVQLDIYFIAEISQPPYVHQELQQRHIMRWCRNNECK